MGALPTQSRAYGRLSLWALAFWALTATVNIGWLVVSAPGGKALPSALAGLLESAALRIDLLYFLAAAAAAHVVIACAWHFVWRAQTTTSNARADLLALLLLVLWLLAINAWLHPKSLFAPALGTLGTTVHAVLAVALTAFVLVVVVRAAWRRPAIGAVTVALAAWWLLAVFAWPAPPGSPVRDQPDVILIGVDGLRPDHVGRLTPNLDALLAEAAVFEQAWTPLARTFPAWLSVLTGQYPTTHGGVFNLVSRSQVADGGSLAHQLGGRRYERVYAIDETRFSNIDASYGFDTVVAPAIGAFDFLATEIGDLPVVNLVARTPFGRALFPNLHMNRAASKLYEPGVFDRALRRAVYRTDASRPLFLVAHFELPHWPFTWATPAPQAASLGIVSHPHYEAAVAAADRQVGALLDALADAGRLDNAVLVVLSDHGEAFRGSEPVWRGPRPAIAAPPGHGTSALSATQNRVLLGFRGYGPQAVESAVFRDTVSLVDVRPTLNDWLDLDIPAPVRVDGVSLLPRLEGGGPLHDRVVLVETGFSPELFDAAAVDTAVLAGAYAQHYDIDAAGRLVLKASHVRSLRARKAHAAIAGDWTLAALPDGSDERRLVLAHRASQSYWTLDDSVPSEAPVPALLEALCRVAESARCR